MADAETTGSKQRGRQFRKGQSGNPAGRPKGSRQVAIRALDVIGTDAAVDLVNTAIQMARGGDVQALRIVLDRVWPAKKGAPCNFVLPAGESVVAMVDAVLDQVSAGELTPDEGAAVMSLIEVRRKAVETEDFAARIDALEARTARL